MAVNQHPKGPPNTLGDIGSQHVPSSITRALEKAGIESQRYKQLTETIGRVQEDPVYKQVEQNPSALSNSDTAKQFRSLEEQRRRAVRQQEIIEESSRLRTIGQVGNAINQSFASGTINGQVQGRLGSIAMQQEALRQSTMSSPEMLQRRINASDARLRGYEAEASHIATHDLVNRFGEVDPSKQGRINELYGLREQELNRRAAMSGAERIHKRQGVDPESKMDSLVDIVGKAQRTPINDQAADAAKKLIDAFSELGKVTDTTTKEFKDLQKNVDSARKDFEAAGGGKGTGDRLGMWAGAASAAGGVLGSIGGMIQQVGVNQNLARYQNIAGIGNIENQKYAAYKAAAGGNIGALLQLGQFGEAGADAMAVGKNAQLAVGFGAAGGVASGVGGILSMLKGASKLASGGGAAGAIAGAGDLAGGMNQAVAGEVNAVVGGFDLWNNISRDQAKVATFQASMQARQAVMSVGAEQLQGFRDYTVGTGAAVRGMGAGGESYLQRTIGNDAFLPRLAAMGISPEQFSQMTEQGVNSMGSTFNEGQISSSRALERRGLGTMQENMGRMATLASAGTNNPQESLARMLEVALPKGLDSSKALNAVAEHTASMARTSVGAAMGFDTTGAAGQLLMQGITKDTPNKEAAIERAASAQELARQYGSNVGVSFAGMTAVARARKRGLSGIEAVIEEGVDTESLMSMRSHTPKQRRQELMNLGIDVSKKTDAQVNSMVSGFVEDRQMKLLESGGKGFLQRDLVSLNKKINSASSVEELGKDEAKLGQIASLAGYKGGAGQLFNVLKGLSSTVDPNLPTGKQAMDYSKDEKSLRNQMDDLRVLGFKQLSTAAQSAATELKGASAAISTIVSAFKGLESAMPAVEKSAGTAAARAVTGGAGLDVSGFNGVVGKLDKVLDKALTKVSSGIMLDREKIRPPHQ